MSYRITNCSSDYTEPFAQHSRPAVSFGFHRLSGIVWKQKQWLKWKDTLNNLMTDQQHLLICLHNLKKLNTNGSHRIPDSQPFWWNEFFSTVKWVTALTFLSTGHILSNSNLCLDCHYGNPPSWEESYGEKGEYVFKCKGQPLWHWELVKKTVAAGGIVGYTKRVGREAERWVWGA